VVRLHPPDPGDHGPGQTGAGGEALGPALGGLVGPQGQRRMAAWDPSGTVAPPAGPTVAPAPLAALATVAPTRARCWTAACPAWKAACSVGPTVVERPGATFRYATTTSERTTARATAPAAA
jgi:hypothetical protein